MIQPVLQTFSHNLSCVYLQLNGQIFELPVLHTFETPECCNKILFRCLQSMRKALCSRFMLCSMSIPLYIPRKIWLFLWDWVCDVTAAHLTRSNSEDVLQSVSSAIRSDCMMLQLQLCILQNQFTGWIKIYYPLSYTLTAWCPYSSCASYQTHFIRWIMAVPSAI
jgi:hypothetical protein